MDNANFIYFIILDSAITVTTQTSRSSRFSRSKGPFKSIILRNKQKEKEELNNQILLQKVKDRYETLAISALKILYAYGLPIIIYPLFVIFFQSESTYDIICRISEKLKSIDLDKLSFNNPLLLFILDLNRIDSIINDLIPKSLLKEASQYENV